MHLMNDREEVWRADPGAYKGRALPSDEDMGLEVGIVHEGEAEARACWGQQLGLSASCTSAIPGSPSPPAQANSQEKLQATPCPGGDEFDPRWLSLPNWSFSAPLFERSGAQQVR